MAPSPYELDALKKAKIDPAKIGCVMLDFEPPTDLLDALDEDWAFSTDKLPWIKGIIRDKSHVTLLYGLLTDEHLREASYTLQFAVEEVLDDWEVPSPKITGVDTFPASKGNGVTGYAVIYAKLGNDDGALLEANQRLSLLPHINTYPEYKAHLTLAYVKEENVEDALDALRLALPSGGLPLTATRIRISNGMKG